ncbi:MAG: hypothetical protein IJK41_03905 [Muribaculaceae bacterium]|nr:hypothetical protein [Muribaculaceae bacterium]
MKELGVNDVFGLLKTSIDVHTLGLSTVYHLLLDCGYGCYISPEDVSEAVEDIKKLNNYGIIKQWINQNHISVLGFSYRLDPYEARDYFCKLYYALQADNMFADNGGCIKLIYFAGLPDSCDLVQREIGKHILVFEGDESPQETLLKLGVPERKLPRDLVLSSQYDKMRTDFAKKLIESESYKDLAPRDHLGYLTAGTNRDNVIDRLNYCTANHSLPLIRAHAGPYNPNRVEAVKEFMDWAKTLSSARYLDVLSIGTSQLTQSRFGENWDGLPNGGGVPVNSELEYRMISDAAKPMLVRTYAGSNNLPWLAKIHENALNICWHALSFWWFCEIDGRGPNTVKDNLHEMIETIKYISSTGKPLEPNVPHHFAFRGGDDVTFIISGYLAAKTAKKYGIKHLILQNMLNTPKYTVGIQDIAKCRAMLSLVRTLEDDHFKVHLQLRAGLDYFAPDLDKAKVQLAEVTALMDDIEPNNDNSPEIIHVVSYSEAVRLATPDIINDSIKITLSALESYRTLRKAGKIENMAYDRDVNARFENLKTEALESIRLLENHIPNLYTPSGLFKVFEEGFLPVPYLMDPLRKYPKATKWQTALKDGGIKVVDGKGKPIYTPSRYLSIINEGI